MVADPEQEVRNLAKKVLWILFAVVLVLALAVAGVTGYFWYQNNHIFVEDAVYPINAKTLDLRGQDISFEHYDAVHSQLPNCEIYWDVPFQVGKYPNDTTKLTVYTLDIGLAGIEVYDKLRDEYDIQLELGDIGNILAYISIGDRMRETERLVSALYDIRRRYKKDRTGLFDHEYINPSVVMTPQEAFYAEKEEMIPIRETNGRICTEFVMCYPPGIPILAPGERITQEIIDYIVYAKEKGCSMTGPEDETIERLNVIREATLY